MAQTFVRMLVHLVFSTKHRKDLILPDIEASLHAYTTGTLKNLGCPCLIVNGTANHVHNLFLHNKNLALSELVREFKKASSKWIKDQGRAYRQFGWQEGYGAFSVSESSLETVRRYIRKQKEKHRKMTFEDEFLQLLKKHRMPYDPRYIWD